MNGPFTFHGIYGVASTFYFCLEDGSTTDAYTGTDVVAADSTISKDGGASAATTNAVVTTNSPFFAITLTATEMQATKILVRLNDASAAVFKDCVLLIITKLELGQVTVDATAIGGNTYGMRVIGVGTGAGLRATSGNGSPAYAIHAEHGTGGGVAIFADGSTGTNAGGFTMQGSGTASGLAVQAGATGIGMNVKGGSTSGAGMNIQSQAGSSVGLAISAVGGNARGVDILGAGTQQGLFIQGGATGDGVRIEGGATSGVGLRINTTSGTAVSVSAGGGNGHGILSAGNGTGDGFQAQGGSSGRGMAAVGSGASAGLLASGGATGDGILAQGGATSGSGFRGQGSASLGWGFEGSGASGIANWGSPAGSVSWDDTEGAEPTAVIGNNATFRQIMQHIKRAILNKADEDLTQRRIYRDDSSTVLETQSITIVGNLKTRGKAA